MGRLVCEILGSELAGTTDQGELNALSYVDAQVVIDFSLPQGTAELLRTVELPLVVGTTGLDSATEAALRAHAERHPVVWASNFSTGVNLLFELVRTASSALPDYDLEIVEMHHRHKVDAPSGTARSLAQAASEGRGSVVHGREGHTGERPPGEIGMHALRGGDVAGEHMVYLAGPGERLQLGHLATSRRSFAEGAIRAARWVVGKPPKLYTMREVLGL